ncbi:MAG: MlaD family protein [Balneolaceae bacterium]|nr:MlaD family protein [Balneolaceae bacterium]
MLNLSNEVKVGITVLLAFIIAFVGFRFMRDIPIFRQTFQIYAIFERGDGISRGSLVNVNGVKVGSVSSVRLTSDNRVRVTMSLDGEFAIPEGTVAQLTSLGIVEGKSIVLRLGDSDTYVDYGDEIEGVYVESVTEVLGSRSEEIAGDVSQSLSELNTFLRQLNNTFDDSTRVTLDETIYNASKTAKQLSDLLNERQRDISRGIQSGSQILARLDSVAMDNSPRVDSIMVALEKNISELEELRTELEGATTNLNQILDKINRGEGTIGKLVNDPAVYDNMEELSRELSRLVKDLNENPGRFLRHMDLIELF